MSDVAAITEAIGIDQISLDDGEHVEDGRTGSISSQLVSFGIGEDQCGVDIIAIREIREGAEVTHLPCRPQYLRGALDRRGVVVPIIDRRCRFGQGLTECTNLLRLLGADFSVPGVAA